MELIIQVCGLLQEMNLFFFFSFNEPERQILLELFHIT